MGPTHRGADTGSLPQYCLSFHSVHDLPPPLSGPVSPEGVWSVLSHTGIPGDPRRPHTDTLT